MLSHADDHAGDRHGNRDEEEQEPGGKGGVRGHAQLPEEADEERLARRSPLIVNGTSMTRKSSGPVQVVHPPWPMPTASAVHPDGQHAHGLNGEREAEDADQQPRMRPMRMHPGRRRGRVGLPATAAAAARFGPTGACRAREDGEGEQDRRDDERELDPEVSPDVVLAERGRRSRLQREQASPRRREHARGEPSLRSARPSLVPPRGLRRSARRRHRQRWAAPAPPRRRRSTRQPAEPVLDGTRAKELLPAPCHRNDGHGHDRHGGRQPPVIRVAQDLDRLVEVDLPDDVGDTQAGDEQRRGSPNAASLSRSLPVNRACTRRKASIASAMSSAEWAEKRPRKHLVSRTLEAATAAGRDSATR